MTESPRVSLFVFCYQQADFIEEAMNSALAQDYGNLQIIISDDHSSDNTFGKIQRLAANYQGPHQLTLNRNEHNLGIGQHFIHIMEHLVEGELVVASGGDDISAPNRVSRIVEEWLTHGKPALVAHGLEEIDEKGQLFPGSRTVQYRLQPQPDKWPAEMALTEYLQHSFPLPYIGAALSYRRDTYQIFGTPAAEPAYEDHLMYFRALLQGDMHYFPQVLVQYRRHSNNFTAKPAKRAAKTLPVPALYQPLLASPATFAADKVGIFRLHQLTTQQWLDYRTAVQTGRVSADVSVVSALWQQLSWRHCRLLPLSGGLSATWRLWRYGASQVMSALGYQLGRSRYVRHDAVLGLDYAPPLRTVVFGAGLGGERALANLTAGFEVVALCDNNSRLHGRQFCGLTVISPAQLHSDIATIDCVVIASTFYYEIKARLIDEFAIPQEKICRAPYSTITKPFPAAEAAPLSNALLLTAIVLLSTLVALWLS